MSASSAAALPGLAIARKLAAHRIKVLVVESWQLDRENGFSSALNQVETCGEAPVVD